MKHFLNISDINSNHLTEIINEAKARKLNREGFNKLTVDKDKPLDAKAIIIPSGINNIKF